jgi:hydrogenase expression/formation protein HypD
VKYVDEFRDAALARRTAAAIARITTRPWMLMEICGGQTHSIVRHGIDQLLPPGVSLLHGPGCPVCVTPAESIDTAVAIAGESGVIFCSFGDMLRVPGHGGSLLAAKARGADVRMVYSPLDALRIARETPDRQVVFFCDRTRNDGAGNRDDGGPGGAGRDRELFTPGLSCSDAAGDRGIAERAG